MDKKTSGKGFPSADLEALSKAYEASLSKVGVGGKPAEAADMKKSPKARGNNGYVPKDYKPIRESSPEHDRIVEKIRERHRTLSHSVWTDEPVLKPKKSVWLDEDSGQSDKGQMKKAAVQPKPVEKSVVTADNTAPSAEKNVNTMLDAPGMAAEKPILPILNEAHRPKKKELVMSIDRDGSARIKESPKPSSKRQLTVTVPKGGGPRRYAPAKQPVTPREELYRERRAAPRPAPQATSADSGSRRTVSISMPVSKPEPTESKKDSPEPSDVREKEQEKPVEKIRSDGAAAVETEKPAREIPAADTAEGEKTEKKTAEATASAEVNTSKSLGRKRSENHELEFDFINCIVCTGIVFIVFISLLFMKRESGFIQSENRDLAVFPEFSVSSYFKGDYTEGITEYFTDTIPGRESFKIFCAGFTSHLGIRLDDTVIAGKRKTVEKEKLDEDKLAATTTVTAFTGKADGTTATSKREEKNTETTVDISEEELDDGGWEGNVIVCGKGKDVRAVGAYYGTFDVGAQYADTINKWKEELPDVNIYNMSIPTSGAYYMPANLRDTVSDQKDNIVNIASYLKGIINVDVFNILESHSEEYIYSRTDHHWQPLGAYYAGKIFADKAGIEYPDLGEYEKCEIEDFLGTMYAYSEYNQELADNPDTFIYYKPDNSYTTTYYNTDLTGASQGDLFFDYAEGVNCYSAILNVDNQIAEIDTDCDNGRVLVVFKDSFGNALIPFFTHGFSKIYVCDFRYFDINAIDFCRQVGCTDLLFAVSLTSCSTPTHISAINNIRVQNVQQPAETAEETSSVQTQESEAEGFAEE